MQAMHNIRSLYVSKCVGVAKLTNKCKNPVFKLSMNISSLENCGLCAAKLIFSIFLLLILKIM